MSKKSLRSLIIILTLVTAGVHLIVLNLLMLQEKGSIDPLFTLNGLGYLALLAAFLFNIPAGRTALVQYVFMGYTFVTILAWVIINGDFSDPLSLVTKADEVLLIAALWLHLKRS